MDNVAHGRSGNPVPDSGVSPPAVNALSAARGGITGGWGTCPPGQQSSPGSNPPRMTRGEKASETEKQTRALVQQIEKLADTEEEEIRTETVVNTDSSEPGAIDAEFTIQSTMVVIFALGALLGAVIFRTFKWW